MAVQFQVKRNTVSGVRPTTSNIQPGELAINTTDGIMFSANSSAVFEVGSNLTSLAVGNTVVRNSINSTGIYVGNTTTNVVISNTVSSFGGNLAVTGVANVTGNVTLGSAAFFVGNGVYLTTVNATNITTGTLPYAQLGANVVNTSGSFTITGLDTFQANLHTGNSVVNTQISNATILISNSTTTTTLDLTDLRLGSTTTNVVIANTTSSFGGNVSVASSINLTQNATKLSFTPLAGGANVYFTQQNDDNFVFYSTNTSNQPRAIWSVFGNSITSSFNFNVPASVGNVSSTGSSYIANGFYVVPGNWGEVKTNITLNSSNGNYQYWASNGAYTITAPTQDCAIDILLTNGTAAGTITFSGFTVGSATGSAYTTTNGNRYILSIRRINSISTYSWYALQ